MLEIEVELSQETKTIEWNKVHPTFRELKERLRQCGIAAGKNFCVEVNRAGEFLTLDDGDLLDGPLIRVRVTQILCNTPWKRAKPDQPPMKDRRTRIEKAPRSYHNSNSELFLEDVIPFVGRVFVLPMNLQDNICIDDCTGTVGLVGPKGESIGAFHPVKKAWKHPRRYDVYIKYTNHIEQPCFPAKILIYNDELDIFIATPLPPFNFDFSKFLHPASGVAVGDTVHCLGFPKLIIEEALSQIKHGTLKELDKHGTLKELDKRGTLKELEVEFPTVFTGNVCFAGWKQGLADYRSFPKSSGAVLVDEKGRLKGIHVAALSAAEYVPEVVVVSETESGRSLSERTRELYERVNQCLPQVVSGVKRSAEAAVFVPISVLMKSLGINPSKKAVLYP